MSVLLLYCHTRVRDNHYSLRDKPEEPVLNVRWSFDAIISLFKI